MDVIVDGTKGFTPKEEPADVMELVVAVSDWLHEQGRSIMAVKTDGEAMDPATMVEVLTGKPLSSVDKLEIDSEHTARLVGESLAELEAVLPELPKACHDLAAVFQGADPVSGYQPFQELADIWSHVKSRQKMIADALGIALDDLDVRDRQRHWLSSRDGAPRMQGEGEQLSANPLRPSNGLLSWCGVKRGGGS